MFVLGYFVEREILLLQIKDKKVRRTYSSRGFTKG